MSRYVESEWLKEHTEFISYMGMWHETETDEFVSRDTIDSAPSIEIVRCKECKHIYTMDCAFYEVGDNVKPDDFCSYGEVSEKPTGSERSSE